jgi:aspartyl-tRNA(Asn)/glutamyl-tRNA(Gln) amidotransferase subunit A
MSDVAPPAYGGLDDWGTDWTQWSPFTYLFNITQSPAISVPCGLTDDGLPVGLQLVGPSRSDELVLRAASAFERSCRFRPLDAIS